ncbi:hypothetical protein FUAX_23750 [Fulvitalea axinellae]|uniref:DUF4301 domain-containing protein n=1 Tax=Fulvitalea axinellae TaxID=1182444 RepID=A0AAU9CIP1_9BACT|nr:hypothetical protein FUAX_23750 [Fulvitalea axinellae]
MQFSEKDLNQLKAKGMSPESVTRQLSNFESGFPFLNIVKAASIGDGITALDEDSAEEYALAYDRESKGRRIVKFTPASGAATRMFKHLFEYLNGTCDMTPAVKEFFSEIKSFSFWSLLEAVAEKQGWDIEELLKKKEYKTVLELLLTPLGLNYGSMPKGLLEFHSYKAETRTPLEEHFVEGVTYAKGNEDTVRLHFTVSPEHLESFRELSTELSERYKKTHGISVETEFSVQKPKTDTIAVEEDLTPFRDDDGGMLFRPGGHGALIENLNDLDAEIVFLKNIDNVVCDRFKRDTYLYKQALGGLLLDYERKIHLYMDLLEHEDSMTSDLIEEMNNFVEEQLCVLPYDRPANREENIYWLRQKLNRPIRVCGMVKNEGEPGGGPFWVINEDHSISLQIVEQAQIDSSNEVKATILKGSTHFNPVDLVCSIRDYRGEPFNLENFVDHKAGFITKKTRNGRPIVAQERPGLWNGAMSDWNTIFVEVPVSTFNPVKSVNDLLKEAHQPDPATVL